MLQEQGITAIAGDNQRCRLKPVPATAVMPGIKGKVAATARPLQLIGTRTGGVGFADDFLPRGDQIRGHAGAPLDHRVKQF